MAQKSVNWRMWSKIIGIGIIVSVGGPAFTAWVTPSEEALRAKYNPDLRKRSLEQKDQRQEEFNDFVGRLKEYSKSDKSIWVVMKEEEERKRNETMKASKQQQSEADARREEMRKDVGLNSK